MLFPPLFLQKQKTPVPITKGRELTRVATLIESIIAFLSSRDNGSLPEMLTSQQTVPHFTPGWIHKSLLSVFTNHRLSIRNVSCYYFLSTHLSY